MSEEIIQTELFNVCFSKTKDGKDDLKFKPNEKKDMVRAVKQTEDTLIKFIGFSRTQPIGKIYTVPIIFEKVKKTTFEERHPNHLAIIDFLHAGTYWGGTLKVKGIEIKDRTALISLCPFKKEHLFETIYHETVHAFVDSFLSTNGVNGNNEEYLIEGLAEALAQITKRRTIIK